MVISEEEWELVGKRFEALNENFKLVSLGEIPILTKEEILKHIKAKDEIGRQILEHQLYYLRKLKERKIWLTYYLECF